MNQHGLPTHKENNVLDIQLATNDIIQKDIFLIILPLLILGFSISYYNPTAVESCNAVVI